MSVKDKAIRDMIDQQYINALSLFMAGRKRSRKEVDVSCDDDDDNDDDGVHLLKRLCAPLVTSVTVSRRGPRPCEPELRFTWLHHYGGAYMFNYGLLNAITRYADVMPGRKVMTRNVKHAVVALVLRVSTPKSGDTFYTTSVTYHGLKTPRSLRMVEHVLPAERSATMPKPKFNLGEKVMVSDTNGGDVTSHLYSLNEDGDIIVRYVVSGRFYCVADQVLIKGDPKRGYAESELSSTKCHAESELSSTKGHATSR